MDPTSLDPTHPTWPRELAELDAGEAPRNLRVRGAWPPEGGPAIALVGSRAASPEGLALARQLARELAEAGAVIWSGGAVGIDAAAHEGALDAGVATVGVIGSGLAEGFPWENAGLFERIVASGRGALVACCDDEEKATRARFHERNRVVAACTRALVIVECGVRSGARNAAAVARRLDLPVGVVPYTPGSGLSPGGIVELTELGARPVFSAAHILNLAMRGTTACDPAARPRLRGASTLVDAPPRPRSADPEDPSLRTLLRLLRDEALHVDTLGARAGIDASALGRALFALSVEGLVREATPGVWAAT